MDRYRFVARPAPGLGRVLVPAVAVEVAREFFVAVVPRYPAAGDGAEFPSAAPGVCSAGMP